ncbi:MAG: hypothetical protein FWD84_04210 [Oscillospiraceae bacterium]|nr:hypothetical protein [Oscillospiraceae bacterium]
MNKWKEPPGLGGSFFASAHLAIVNELKEFSDLQGYLLSHKAEDAGGLTPGKDDNAVGREIERKDETLFKFVDYTYFYLISKNVLRPRVWLF